jgi:ribosomal protein S18 acetylase RimI-like enzyme
LAAAFSLQALSAPDAAKYNAFLTRGVRQHPDTLRIAEADILAVPFTTEPTADSVTFVAVHGDGAFLGTVAVERERGREKRRHVAWLLRMYVASEHAGRGVGRALLLHAIAHARSLQGVAKLNLTVAAHNARAVALYERHGFREFSREEDAFRDPTPRAELSMSLAL